MLEKKQLSDEELEKITGGCIGTEDPHYTSFSGFVNMYCLEENHEYYFTSKNIHGGVIEWFRGIVKRTWEQKTGIICTERTHKVQITEMGNGLGSSWSIGDTIDIQGDTKAVYTTKI